MLFHLRRGPVALALAMTLAAPGAGALESRPMLDLALAQQMVQGCIDVQAQEELPPLNFAIMDRGADLVLFLRQDDAMLGGGAIAVDKARSVVNIPLPTRVIGELSYGKDGGAPIVAGLQLADVVAFAGGLPIRTSDGALLGGIGVSGGTPDEDEICAKAALAAVAGAL
ncbi:MAG: heme-binding protein [Rhodobacteraceae bacterium]|nr:heme-binding protein [Paracoccaceae bacterium]